MHKDLLEQTRVRAYKMDKNQQQWLEDRGHALIISVLPDSSSYLMCAERYSFFILIANAFDNHHPCR